MKYEPMIMYDILNYLDCAQRQFPIGLRHPTRYSQLTRVLLPRKASIPVSELFIDNESFRFSKTLTNMDDTTKLIRFSFQTKTDNVSVEAFPKVCSEMNDAVNSCVILIIAPDEYRIKPRLKGNMLERDRFPFNAPIKD